jgi:rubrerythrin
MWPVPDVEHRRPVLWQCLACEHTWEGVLHTMSGTAWASPEECPCCGVGASQWREAA